MTDLDELMSKDPLSLTKTDIDSIIAYERKHRADVEAGIKTKKPGVAKTTISLDNILGNLIKPKVVNPVKRRV